MKPIVFRMVESTTFSPWSNVVTPVGDLVAITRTAEDQHFTEQGVAFGIWEFTRGRWRRQIPKREFSHILAGHCFFTPDAHEPIERRAGDSVFFPANCSGIWDIREKLRKSYLIID